MPARLSTDILNRYNEALMLIELVPSDKTILADLRAWRPLDYRAHFETSRLRDAPDAIAAYDALPVSLRRQFDDMLARLDQLTAMTIDALCEAPPDNWPGIASRAAAQIRAQISAVSSFINTGGRMPLEVTRTEELQAQIDHLFRR